MLPYTARGGCFLGSGNSYEDSKAVILGLPMDFTVSFRPGTRSGPDHIRQASIGIEEYSPILDRDIAEASFFDAGDMELPFGNVKYSLDRIEKAAVKILSDAKKPVFLGGEHLVSLPLIKALKEHYEDLVVIQFDAHADLRTDYMGEKLSHATVMRQVSEIVGMKNLYQVGIRSGTKQEFQFGREHTNFYPYDVMESLTEILPGLADKPVYITLDIDVVDPAHAPGTGTPEPGGCSSKEIMEAVYALRSLRIVGADLVEVSPVGDSGLLTGLLAAKLVREMILGFWPD